MQPWRIGGCWRLEGEGMRGLGFCVVRLGCLERGQGLHVKGGWCEMYGPSLPGDVLSWQRV
jgi:hypothetical protein